MATTQTLTDLPNIQYAGMDFDTVVSEIQEIIENNPNWSSKWTNFYSSEAGTLLIQLMAWITDNLSLKQDLVYNEMFLDTANKEKDILRLLKQINYIPALASSSKIPITLEFSSVNNTNNFPIMSDLTDITNRTSEIIGFTADDINGDSTHYEILNLDSDNYPDYLGSILLSEGNSVYTEDNNGNTLYALEGTTKSETLSSDSSDGPSFVLNSESSDYISSNSIKLYDSNGQELLLVDSFMEPDAKDDSLAVPYIITINTDRKVEIRFASKSIMTVDSEVKTARLFQTGSTIYAFYRTTTGSLGNISANIINTSITINDEQITVYNESSGTGGADEEELSDSVINAPLSLRHMNRAVTPDDYDSILNEYTDMKLSKTYTSYNAPTDFKTNYYGRYLNPQESYSLILLNKNYEKVSPSKYNNFSWASLNREPILNEKYVFDEAEFNSAVTYSNSYHNLTIVTSEGNTKTYSNAILVTMPTKFISKALTEIGYLNSDSSEDDDFTLKLKLNNESGTYNYFNSIPFGLIEETNSDNYSSTLSKSDVLKTTAPIVSKDVHARFTSSVSYKKGTPIDCINYTNIIFNLDDKTLITINLKEELDTSDNLTAYYLLLDNTPDGTTPSSSLSKNSSDYAVYRKGIVQLINEQIVELEESGGDYEALGSTRSYQYFGINKATKTGTTDNVINDITSDLYLGMNINGVDYCFALNSAVKSSALSYFTTQRYYYKYPTPTTADGSTKYYQISSSSVVTPVSGTALYNGNTALYYSMIEYSSASFDGDTGNGLNVGELADVLEYEIETLGSITSTYIYEYNTLTSTWSAVSNADKIKSLSFICKDKTIFSTNGDATSGTVYDLGILSLNSYGLITSENKSYISINNCSCLGNYITDSFTFYTAPLTRTVNSMAHYLLGLTLSSGYDYSEILPTVQVAADYENVASVIGIKNSSGVTYQKLRIESPLYGKESSSIYIKQSNTDSNYDFMKNALGISYYDGVSITAKGIRKAEMYIENGITATSKYPTDTTATSISDIPTIGNIIFEFNDITPFADTVYANYKLSSNGRVRLGNVRNNWYSPDSETPPDVHGIVGEYISKSVNDENKTVYKINEGLSDFNIRFTTSLQDTNSLYAIKSDVNVIPCDHVEITTNVMSTSSSSFEIPFSFKIDNMNDYYNISVGNISSLTASNFYSKIESYFSSNENSSKIATVQGYSTSISDNFDAFIRTEYDSPNQLVFSNFLKNSSANFTFHFPTESENGTIYSQAELLAMVENVKLFYKHILGTNKTNTKFYELYPKALFENDDSSLTKVFYVDNDNTEYYYAPILSGQNLVTETRTLYLNSGVYYTDAEFTKSTELYVAGETAVSETLVNNGDGTYTETYSVYDSTVSNNGDLTFEYRKLVNGVSYAYDYYVEVVGDDTSNYIFYINKTDDSNFPDGEFYIHFIQDRTYETNSSGSLVNTDERTIQNYMNKHKISGTDIIFAKPYFKNFDISGTVIYNNNYNYSVIQTNVEKALNDKYNIENYSIGTSILKSDIYKIITSVEGVEGVNIEYFGHSYSDQTTYPTNEHVMNADFYEILTLNETTTNTGLIFTYETSTDYFNN